MADTLLHHPEQYPSGYTAISDLNSPNKNAGINFGILKMQKGESKNLISPFESAYLLMNGEIDFIYDGKTYHAHRSSLFDENPIAIHFAPNQEVMIEAKSDCELAVSQVENSKTFETVLFDENNMLESERRGKGLLNDTSYRIVRTIFDIRNRPDANLVLGEVITFPGCWSSYPPHHHPQPEIYHYRFTEPQGYGHGELGDQIYKVTQNDTLFILSEEDHAQAAAPGYGMYYIWPIRHLPDNPYTIPEFTKEHEWCKTTEANSRVWQLK